MSRRKSNIYKRNDGRWEARLAVGRKENGYIKYRSIYAKSYQEAKIKLENACREKECEIVLKKQLLFKDILNLWIANNELRLKKSSISKYKNIINTHILPELGSIKLSEINAIKINDFLVNKLKKGRLNKQSGLSASYVRSMMLIINATINFAVKEELMKPLKNVIYKPPIEKKEIMILTKEEQKKLESYIINNLNATTIGIMISLYTGLRIGEICSLTWENIDLKNQVIHVRHTVARINNNEKDSATKSILIIDSPKTNTSFRSIPITDSLLRALKRYSHTSNSNYVVSENSKFVSPRTFDYRFHTVLKQCDIKSVNYHALRHTFATRCIDAGVDIKSLSEILGHSNVSITLNTYVHSSMEMKRNQLKKINNL